MIRLMCGVTLQTCVPSEDLLHNSGLVDIRRVLKRNRLRMFGHVARRGTDEPLGKVRCLEAPGWSPPGRPKRVWKKIPEKLALTRKIPWSERDGVSSSIV